MNQADGLVESNTGNNHISISVIQSNACVGFDLIGWNLLNPSIRWNQSDTAFFLRLLYIYSTIVFLPFKGSIMNTFD